MLLTIQTQLAAECLVRLVASPAQVRAALPKHAPDAGGRWWMQDAQGRKAMLWASAEEPGTWRAVGSTTLIEETFGATPRRRLAALLGKVLRFFF